MEKLLTLHPTNDIRAFDVDLTECNKAFIASIYWFRFALPDLQYGRFGFLTNAEDQTRILPDPTQKPLRTQVAQSRFG